MVVHVAQEQARFRPVDDEAEVATDTRRPEVLVLRLVQFVKLHPRIRRVHLEIEGRRLHGLLLLTGQANKAVCEGIGDAEVHQSVDFLILGAHLSILQSHCGPVSSTRATRHAAFLS